MIVTIDSRDLFTAHKPNCAHLQPVGDAWLFDLVVEPASRAAARAELDAEGFADSDLAFAPCLGDLPEVTQ